MLYTLLLLLFILSVGGISEWYFHRKDVSKDVKSTYWQCDEGIWYTPIISSDAPLVYPDTKLTCGLYVDPHTKKSGLCFSGVPTLVDTGTVMCAVIVNTQTTTCSHKPFVIEGNFLTFKDYEWARDTIENCYTITIHVPLSENENASWTFKGLSYQGHS